MFLRLIRAVRLSVELKVPEATEFGFARGAAGATIGSPTAFQPRQRRPRLLDLPAADYVTIRSSQFACALLSAKTDERVAALATLDLDTMLGEHATGAILMADKSNHSAGREARLNARGVSQSSPHKASHRSRGASEAE